MDREAWRAQSMALQSLTGLNDWTELIFNWDKFEDKFHVSKLSKITQSDLV